MALWKIMLMFLKYELKIWKNKKILKLGIAFGSFKFFRTFANVNYNENA